MKQPTLSTARAFGVLVPLGLLVGCPDSEGSDDEMISETNGQNDAADSTSMDAEGTPETTGADAGDGDAGDGDAGDGDSGDGDSTAGDGDGDACSGIVPTGGFNVGDVVPTFELHDEDWALLNLHDFCEQEVFLFSAAYW